MLNMIRFISITLVFLFKIESNSFIDDKIKGIIWFDSIEEGFCKGSESIAIKKLSNGYVNIYGIYKNTFCSRTYDSLGHLVSAYTGLIKNNDVLK